MLVGEDVVRRSSAVQWRPAVERSDVQRRWRDFLLLQCPCLRDRTEGEGVVTVVAANLVSRACGPHPLLIGTAQQGPATLVGWAPPIREQIRVQLAFGPTWWRSILTFSPLISPYIS